MRCKAIFDTRSTSIGRLALSSQDVITLNIYLTYSGKQNSRLNQTLRRSSDVSFINQLSLRICICLTY